MPSAKVIGAFTLFRMILISHKEFSLELLLSRFSHVRPCVTPWTAAHQDPSVHLILQAGTLEWVVLLLLSWVVHSPLWCFNQLSRISKSILAIKKKNSSEIYLRRSTNFLKSSGHFDGRPLSSGCWREDIQLSLKKFAFSAGNWKRRCC